MNRGNRAHIYIFVVMIISLVAQLIISVILNSTGQGMTFISSALITQYGLVLLPAIIYFIITKSSIKNTLHFKKVSATNVFLAIGLAIFIQPIMSLINLISQLFVKNYMMDYVDDMMAMPFWLLLLIMAVTPAITEEITFRGIVLRNYQNQTVIATCLMNGFLFGVFHGNLNQFAYAFFLGAIFCYVAHLTGSIIPSMIMHFIIAIVMIMVAACVIIEISMVGIL
jgi:membrane protease YdiL (CAAX protease family)